MNELLLNFKMCMTKKPTRITNIAQPITNNFQRYTVSITFAPETKKYEKY